MTDREKVLKGWQRCKICNPGITATDEAKRAYVECEYTVGLYCDRNRLMNDTIELLQPVKPTWQGDYKAYCGECGKRIPDYPKARFCRKCGKEIDWN